MSLPLIFCYLCGYVLVGCVMLPFIWLGWDDDDDEDIFNYMLGIILVYPLVLVWLTVKQLTGLYRKLTGKKEKYTEYISVTVEEQDTENTKEGNMSVTKKLDRFMEEREE